MRSKRVNKPLSAIACVLFGAGAAGAWAGETGEDAHGALRPDDLRGAVTLAGTFMGIEERVPGFGGLYRDSDGQIAVWLVNGRERDRAEELLAQVFPQEDLAAGVKILQGTFTFSELSAWRGRASSVLAIPDVVFTDVDEEKNRVTIGVETDEAREMVSLELIQRGIPADAVLIERADPIVEMTTHLQDTFRPLQGGIQVAFDCNGQTCRVCTDGFIATRGRNKGFLTNSHCSLSRGERDGTIYHQPLPTAEVGRERTDTANRSSLPGCPSGRVCRNSDSAFVKGTNGAGLSRGRIARPENKTGSLNLSSTKPPFSIIGRKNTAPIVGKKVNKVGRTTGWSQGRVARTGVDTNVDGTNVTYLDQVWVRASLDHGDSGSPVFFFKGKASRGKVILNGILWGGNFPSADQFIYSTLGQIEDDLGKLKNVCIKNRGC
jgi:hypothetical protein